MLGVSTESKSIKNELYAKFNLHKMIFRLNLQVFKYFRHIFRKNRRIWPPKISKITTLQYIFVSEKSQK